jgi:hypothetical protein
VLFRAPVILGGRDSLYAFGGPNPRALEQAAVLAPAAGRVSRATLEADPALGPVIRDGGEVWYPAGAARRRG